MKVNCSHCGIEFDKKAANVALHDNHFCCMKCMGDYRSTKVTVPCGTCGRPVTRKQSDLKKE